jgi:hypothetical protein
MPILLRLLFVSLLLFAGLSINAARADWIPETQLCLLVLTMSYQLAKNTDYTTSYDSPQFAR